MSLLADRDSWLIDTKTGKTYNFGNDGDAYEKSVSKVKLLTPGSSKLKRSKRFILIHGNEVGFDVDNQKTWAITSLYNENVIKKGVEYGSY